MAKRYQRDLLTIPLVSFGHCIVSLLRLTTSHYPFDIFWPLYCLSSSIDDFSLSLWYLLAIVVSRRRETIQWPKDTKGIVRSRQSKKRDNTMAKRYQRDNEKSSVEEERQYNGQKISKRLLTIPLVSFGHCIVSLLRLTTSHYPFDIFWPLCCLSSSIDTMAKRYQRDSEKSSIEEERQHNGQKIPKG
jgi:hypothetical protein